MGGSTSRYGGSSSSSPWRTLVRNTQNTGRSRILAYDNNNYNFQSRNSSSIGDNNKAPFQLRPGSKAFDDCEFEAIADLFYHFAKRGQQQRGGIIVDDDESGSYLSENGVRRLLESIGERPDDQTLRDLFAKADLNGSGTLSLNEFLLSADRVLGNSPARLVLVVGGPGSGKGILCDRLASECNNVHLSSGDLLRDEVARGTPLGKECADIMARGDLVPSNIITALVRRHTRSFPGRRILLDGFPRSLENATDFLNLCGKPELALHLDCDDTILMERIMKRSCEKDAREDDNVETALRRLRIYHKYHHQTIEWLREQGVPIVNLDCSQSPENVWNQLVAIGRLMRPAVAYRNQDMVMKSTVSNQANGIEQEQPERSSFFDSVTNTADNVTSDSTAFEEAVSQRTA